MNETSQAGCAKPDVHAYYTKFKGINPKGERVTISSFDTIFNELNNPETYANKASCMGLSFSCSINNHRNKDNFEKAYAVMVDYDAGQMSIDDAATLLQAKGLKAFLYTSASNTPEHPRWRVIAPLLKPVDYDGYYELVGAVNAILGGDLDKGSFEAERFYYAGKVEATKDNYQTRLVAGLEIDFCIDYIEDLPAIYPEKAMQAVVQAANGDSLDFKLPLNDQQKQDLVSALDFLASKSLSEHDKQGNNEHWLDTSANWSAIGYALKSVDEIDLTWACKTFHYWSSKSVHYDAVELDQKWTSWKPTNTGVEAVFKHASDQGWINPAKGTKASSATKGFTLTALSELSTNRPMKQWLIKKTLEPRKLHTLIGASGTGKSFLALDMAWHIAHGEAWNGHSVSAKGDVVYIAGEGAAGIADRTLALSKHYNKTMPDNFFISNQGINFDIENDVEVLVEAVKSCTANPALVIIDTLHRNFSSDENSAKDIALLLKNLDTYMRLELGCAVLLVHHSGHSDKDRARGSSAIRAAVDVELLVKKDGDGTITMSCSKAKDFEAGQALKFKLQTVELDHTDNDGEQVTSAIPVYLGVAGTGAKAIKPNEQAALDSLKKIIDESGEDNADLTERLKPDDPFGDGDKQVKAVLLTSWKDQIKDYLKVTFPEMKDGNVRGTAKRITDSLTKLGLVVKHCGFVTIPLN
jgi:AAA domain